MDRSRGWCFTINNYTEDDYINVLWVDEWCEYLIVGWEIGEECGTPHLQCYVYFENAIRFKTLKEMIPRANIRKANGTAAQNRKYCTKEDYPVPNVEFWESGILPETGKRTDLLDIIARLKSGEEWKTVEADYPVQFMLYSQKLKGYIPERKNTCKVYVFQGEGLIEWACENFDNFLEINCEADLFSYDPSIHKAVICIGSMDMTKLELLARGRPLSIRIGYETKRILPDIMIYGFDFIRRADPIVKLVTFINYNSKLPDTEVSGGNTKPQENDLNDFEEPIDQKN